MSRRECIPYTSCDVDPRAHARWVLSQIRPYASEVRDDSGGDSDGSDDSGVECLFRRLPESCRTNLKYVRQKSGGGCGSGKRFVPVSCSKNCPECHGCSPGCGKNYEFEQIDHFFLNSKTWDHLWDQFNKHRHVKYIILELDSSV
jgi:hypothetical protein